MSRRVIQIIVASGLLFPLLFLLALSFGERWIFPEIWPEQWTFRHWQALTGSQSGLLKSVFLSLLISVLLATVATGLSFVTSKTIAFHRQRGKLLLAAYFPYVFAPVILAACLQHYFIVMGLSGKWYGVLLAQLLITYPFGVIFFTSFWNDRMRAMEQLAATLGGSPWQTFQKVLLPVARGALLICFFQTFLISWFEYGLTMLIGVGKVQTLTVSVFLYINEANIFYAAMASCLLFTPPILLLWLNKRYIFAPQSG